MHIFFYCEPFLLLKQPSFSPLPWPYTGKEKYMKSLLERLQQGIVIGAEGYLFELERRGYLKAGAFVLHSNPSRSLARNGDFPSNWTPLSTRALKWLHLHRIVRSWASTTSVPAAAPALITYAPLPKRWGARCRPAGIHRICPSTPCGEKPFTRITDRTWISGKTDLNLA
jgi:hypothetical protein